MQCFRGGTVPVATLSNPSPTCDGTELLPQTSYSKLDMVLVNTGCRDWTTLSDDSSRRGEWLQL
jgi:hypothetical protein